MGAHDDLIAAGTTTRDAASLTGVARSTATPDFHRWWGVGWCLCRSGVRGVGVRGTSLVGILTMWPRSSVV